jgi:hypothetical protein
MIFNMGKRKKKYSKEGSQKDADNSVTPSKKEKNEHDPEEQTTGYGGIPMRDLKKNLGCG